jgi:hypothetical protein
LVSEPVPVLVSVAAQMSVPASIPEPELKPDLDQDSSLLSGSVSLLVSEYAPIVCTSNSLRSTSNNI